MKAYVIVRHFGTPRQEIVANSTNEGHDDAIWHFVAERCDMLCTTVGREWSKLKAAGWSCVECELVLSKGATT